MLGEVRMAVLTVTLQANDCRIFGNELLAKIPVIGSNCNVCVSSVAVL